ncbi:hypothetical protein C8R44DRAFT_570228, partial [Mycena epipterygia]
SLQAAARQFDISHTTLTVRYNGRETRKEKHVEQQKLSPAQELVLKESIRVMGRRGVPLTLTAIAEYASVILDEDISVSWAWRFRDRHPDLKARWTTGLEK